MSKKTLYLLGILGTILLGTLLYNNMCCQECCKEKEIDKNPVVATTGEIDANNFKISGSDFNYDCDNNFKFLSNDFKNIQPVDECVNVGINNLKSYFDKNAASKILITGYALNSEKNTSAFPNLGLARANDLKDYFISKGIASNRFELKGELRDAWKVDKDTVYGPADFSVYTPEATDAKVDWAAIKVSYNAAPLTLYFNTGQAEINLTPEERQKVADLVKYLDNVEGSKLSTVGHTDSAGKRENNIKLGQGRAEFAKAYLAKNGVADARIEASSKGPDEPIADNNTPEGKAKNRRTVVTIK
jgi:OmpA-OmpF porin, OOP family